MTAQNGDKVILKIGDGAVSETFAAIGGLRMTGFSFNSKSAAATHLASGGWQEWTESAGERSVQIQASGFFTDSATEALIRQLAMSNTLRHYQLAFGNGDILQGSFKITHYDRSGAYGAEEIYSLTLESSGVVAYTEI